MDCGYVSPEGMSRSRAASMSFPPKSSVSFNRSDGMLELFLCAGLGCVGIEWLRRDLVALLQKDLDLAFSGFQLRPAIVGKSHAFLEQCKRLFQRHFTFFQLVDDFLE